MQTVYIDPWSPERGNDSLFDVSERPANRDQLLLAWAFVREACAKEGIILKTADLMPDEGGRQVHYYCAYGQTKNWIRFSRRTDVRLLDLYITEPPIASLEETCYSCIPECVKLFRHVHAVTYPDEIRSVYGFEVGGQIEHFFTPQAYSDVIDEYWQRRDRAMLCMVNSYGFAPAQNSYYYDERIRALDHLGTRMGVDLYGHRWNIMWETSAVARMRNVIGALRHGKPAELRRELFLSQKSKAVRRAYRGQCTSKYDTLAGYWFAICYENSGVRGYISEKIFDCFFAGTIPIYLGAPDIADYVPRDCFVDKRRFKSYTDLAGYLRSLSDTQKESYRQAGRAFVASDAFRPFSKEYFAQRFIKYVRCGIDSYTEP